MPIDPRYMSFDHEYAETVTLPSNLWGIEIPAYRLINRKGAYPVAGGYAAGITFYDAFGESLLNFQGYRVRPEQLPTFTGSAVFTYFDLDLETATEVTAPAVPVNYPQDSIIYDAEANNYYFVAAGAGITTVASDLPATLALLVAPNAILIPDFQEIYKGSSTTPLKPSVLKYQKYVSIVTDGIGIVEVDPASGAIDIDTALYAGGTNGLANTTAGAGVLAGRSLDAVPVPGVGGPHYVRLKIGASR